MEDQVSEEHRALYVLGTEADHMVCDMNGEVP